MLNDKGEIAAMAGTELPLIRASTKVGIIASDFRIGNVLTSSIGGDKIITRCNEIVLANKICSSITYVGA